MAVVVVATFKVKLGHESEGEAELRRVIEQTHGHEPGCVLYALHRAVDDPTRFVVVEKWDSHEDLDAHFKQPYMGEIATARDLLAEPPSVWFTEPVATGDPDKCII